MEHTETKKSQTTDTLQIKENEDGSFTMEWDPNDPKWVWLNDMTSEEITKILSEYCDEILKSADVNSLIVEDSLNPE